MALSTRRLQLTAVLAIVSLWLLAAPAGRVVRAQAQKQERADEQAPTIRVNVDVVNLFVTVKDRKGKLINNLNKEDFQVYEDGQPQQIRYFARESALPLTLGLLVDTSVSQGRLVPAEQEASEVFFRRVLAQKDLAFLISFDTNVDLLQDFTNNQELLSRGLGGLKVNSGGSPTIVARGPFSLPPRGTLLYDAVYLAAREKLGGEVGRKAIVIISDGEDQGSKLKLNEAIETAQKSDVIIYGVLFYDRAFYGAFGYSGDSTLKKMAEETGGRVIRVDREKDLARAFEEIAQELRSQYNIGYTPTNTLRDGHFRHLKVKVGEELKVQARKGYYPPAS